MTVLRPKSRIRILVADDGNRPIGDIDILGFIDRERSPLSRSTQTCLAKLLITEHVQAGAHQLPNVDYRNRWDLKSWLV